MTTDRFTARFDGAAAWAGLTDEQRADIGATALEVVVNWNGMDAYEDEAHTRPFHAADGLLLDNLHQAVDAALPDIIAAELLPVPSQLGPVCRRCGCSEQDACFPACGWAEPDLCTACAKPACPICTTPFEPADLCASDIELGICHAACLEGSPTVNLDTGDPMAGPVFTYRHDETGDA